VAVLSRNRQSLFSPASAPCTRVGAPRSRTASSARQGCLMVHRRSYTAAALPPLRVPSPHGRPTSRSSFWPPARRRASCPSEVFCLGPSRSSLLLTITHHPRAMRPVHWLSISPLMSALSTHQSASTSNLK